MIQNIKYAYDTRVILEQSAMNVDELTVNLSTFASGQHGCVSLVPR